MNVVLFLGAGFSRPFGQPTMQEFLEAARASTRITEEEKGLIDDLVLEARSANAYLDSSPTNIEDILSFSVMADRVAAAGDEPARAGVLRHILHRIYSDSPMIYDPPTNGTRGSPFWEQFDRVPELLGTDLSDPRISLSVITTNYDLNVEQALARMEMLSSLPFACQRDPHGGNDPMGGLYRHDGIPVLKLHGSVNWFVDDENVVTVEGRIMSLDSGMHVPWTTASDYEYQGTPLIVPPTFLKPDLRAELRHVWTTAADVLRQAELLIFVGYSFPESDIEMLYLLATCLWQNPRLRQIIVADMNASAIVQRLYSQQHPKLGSHFTHHLRAIHGSWEQTRLHLFDL